MAPSVRSIGAMSCHADGPRFAGATNANRHGDDHSRDWDRMAELVRKHCKGRGFDPWMSQIEDFTKLTLVAT